MKEIDKDWIPVEGVDYEIEQEEPQGPPCPECGHPLEKNYKGHYFCSECIANLYDRYGKQDSHLTLRLSSNLLEDVKNEAQRQGIKHYQEYIRQILINAVNKKRA